MRSDAQLVIRLAVPSVLYAPLYLAKTLARTAETRERFSIFQHVEFDYAGKPFETPTAVDDLILPVLRARELSLSRRAPILAVGDPTRVASALALDTLDQPYVVGGLITKMCYWLMDGRAAAPFNKREKIDEVVVHPEGMTGYSLFRYEVQKRHSLEGARSFACYPGDELREYSARTWCEGLHTNASRRYWGARRKPSPPPRLPSAFLTTDPAIATRARHGKRWRVLRAYTQDDRDEFKHVLMTGLITGRRLYANARRRRQIDAIVSGIAEAIAIIKCDEFLAASCLLNYADQRIDFTESYDVDQLAFHLEELMTTDAFNTHPELKVTELHVQNAVKIRRAAAIAGEAENLQTLESAVQSFVEVIPGVEPSGCALGGIIRVLSRRGTEPKQEQEKQQPNGAVSAYLRRIFSEERSERSRLWLWRLLSVIAIVAITVAGTVSAWSQGPFFTTPLGVSVILLLASLLALYDFFLFIGEQHSRRGRSGLLTGLAYSAALSAGAYHGVRTIAEIWPFFAGCRWARSHMVLHALADTPWFTITTSFLCAFAYVVKGELQPVARERLWWNFKENLRLAGVHLRLTRQRVVRTLTSLAWQAFSMATWVPLRAWAVAKGKSAA